MDMKIKNAELNTFCNKRVREGTKKMNMGGGG